MDLNTIKSKLATLNKSSHGGNKEKKDYTLIYWKPKQEGKYIIRFVPSNLNSQNPFQEIYMHYGVGKFPIVALSNWGEQDPIVDFCKKLRTTGDSENWRLAKKLEPKLRVFAPVIVQGEEEKGVRLFEFSKTLYMELLSIADDEDYGDFTDVVQGFDFLVTATKIQDRPGFSLSLRPKPKEELENYISGEESEGGDNTISSEPPVSFDDNTTKPPTKTNNYSISPQGSPKKAKDKEFDDLFKNDLPFD